MFAQLKNLLAQYGLASFAVTASSENEVTVTVRPGNDDKSPVAIRQPLALTGTAEELDAGFADALARWAGVRGSIADQLKAQEADLEAAGKEAANKVKAAVPKSSSKYVPPAATAATGHSLADLCGEDGNDEGEDDGDGDSCPFAAVPASAPASSGSLADLL